MSNLWQQDFCNNTVQVYMSKEQVPVVGFLEFRGQQLHMSQWEGLLQIEVEWESFVYSMCWLFELLTVSYEGIWKLHEVFNITKTY